MALLPCCHSVKYPTIRGTDGGRRRKSCRSENSWGCNWLWQHHHKSSSITVNILFTSVVYLNNVSAEALLPPPIAFPSFNDHQDIATKTPKTSPWIRWGMLLRCPAWDVRHGVVSDGRNGCESAKSDFVFIFLLKAITAFMFPVAALSSPLSAKTTTEEKLQIAQYAVWYYSLTSIN